MVNFDDLLTNVPTEEQNTPQLSKEDYAAKKKTERDNVFALSDDTALHASGNGEQFRSFLDVQGQFDRYSAVNALLIYAQQESLPNEKATRLGSFDYWKKSDCSVKPGQMAIDILEPHEYKKEDGSPGTGYNVKKVFDISQVDTRKLRVAPIPNYTDRQLLGALIPPKSSQFPTVNGVDELPDDLGAKYDPETDSISVRKGMEFADTFRALAQELSYADLTTGPDTQADPAFSAYCASYLLCSKYGIDKEGFSFEEAPGVFEDMDAQTIKGELSQIRDVVEDISGRMARQLEAAQKAAKNNEAR